MNRWTGPFDTPNLAGVLLAALATVLFAVWARSLRPWQARIAALAGLLCVFGLAASASRAGLLAVVLGSAALAAGRVISWRAWMVAMALVALAVLGWPGVVGRLGGLAADRGIDERLRLWRATLAMCADQPGGVAGPMVSCLERWYLDPDLIGRFATPLNSGLWLLALGGFALFGLFAAVAMAIATVVFRQPATEVLARTGLAAGLALLCGAMFQGLHDHAVWLVALAGAGAAVLIGLSRSPPSRRQVASATVIGGLGGTLCTLFVWLLAAHLAESMPYRITSTSGVLSASPRHNGNGRILVLFAPGSRAQDHVIMHWGRLAAASGWQVTTGPAAQAEGMVQLIEGFGVAEAGMLVPECGRHVLIDPEEVPGIQADCLVLIRARSDFTPRLRLARWAAGGGTLIELAADCSDAELWDHIERWLARPVVDRSVRIPGVSVAPNAVRLGCGSGCFQMNQEILPAPSRIVAIPSPASRASRVRCRGCGVQCGRDHASSRHPKVDETTRCHRLARVASLTR